MNDKQNGNVRVTAQWVSSAVLIALLAYLITAVVRFDRITVMVEGHELRISKIEQCLITEKERQPLRDFILIELARKNGISIPKELQ